MFVHEREIACENSKDAEGGEVEPQRGKQEVGDKPKEESSRQKTLQGETAKDLDTFSDRFQGFLPS